MCSNIAFMMPPLALAASVALLVLPLAAAWGQGRGQGEAVFRAAPAGNPVTVAQRIIRANFDQSICPRVTHAERLEGGSIRATCSNGETFRAFEIDGQPVALRCSVAARRGIEGC